MFLFNIINIIINNSQLLALQGISVDYSIVEYHKMTRIDGCIF